MLGAIHFFTTMLMPQFSSLSSFHFSQSFWSFVLFHDLLGSSQQRQVFTLERGEIANVSAPFYETTFVRTANLRTANHNILLAVIFQSSSGRRVFVHVQFYMIFGLPRSVF